jgi:hypothetical protein
MSTVSDITVAALTATPTLRGNKLAWTYSDPRNGALPNIALDMVEVWASTTNDRATAAKVGEGITDFLHTGVAEEETWYYWIKARDYLPAAQGGPGYGAWHPSGSTAGVTVTAIGMSGLLFGLANGKLVATVGSSALTVAVKTALGNDPSASDKVFVAFRSATAANGNYQIRSLSAALSLVISSGSTLGTTNSTAFRVWIVLFDDAGTLRLGAINCTGSTAQYTLDETSLRSSTAEGGAGAADSLGTVYTGTAVTSKPFRILGFLTWNTGLGTAGTWSAAPDVIQLFGPGVKKPGEQVQYVENTSSTAIKGTGTFTSATAAPPNTEGDQYFSTPITPTSPANWITHDVLMYCDAIPGHFVIIGLFQDSIVNAIAAAGHRSSDFDKEAVVAKALPLRHRQLANTSSQITFKIRGGAQAPGNFDFNGLYVDTGATISTLLGGLITSGHRITEFMG